MKLYRNTIVLSAFISGLAFAQAPTLPDELISESSITQHQDALEIDASQVENLPSGGHPNGDNCAANEYHRGVDEFGNVENCQPIPDDQTASEVPFDSDGSTLTSENVESAIKEVDEKVENIGNTGNSSPSGSSSETATSGATTQGYGILTVTVNTSANNGNGETIITMPEAFASGKTKVFEGDAALRIVIYTQDLTNNTLTLPFATNEIITVDYEPVN